MTSFAIAGIQMSVSDHDSNVHKIEWYAAHVSHRFPWVNMLVFSALALFGPDSAHAVTLPGELEARLSGIAARYRVWLVPGSLFERRGGRIFHTTLVIAPDGTIVGRFAKLFPCRSHEAGVSEGTEFAVFDVAGAGRLGISICRDMWFPETIRQMAAMGAEVILHPTMAESVDRDIERSIARATAAINQCYVFDINGVGSGGCGRSIVVDPAGYVLHEADAASRIMPIMIDFAKVRYERQHGLHDMGQVLKGFRDRTIDFPVYRREASAADFLSTLGPLDRSGAMAGLSDSALDPGASVRLADGEFVVPDQAFRRFLNDTWGVDVNKNTEPS